MEKAQYKRFNLKDLIARKNDHPEIIDNTLKNKKFKIWNENLYQNLN